MAEAAFMRHDPLTGGVGLLDQMDGCGFPHELMMELVKRPATCKFVGELGWHQIDNALFLHHRAASLQEGSTDWTEAFDLLLKLAEADVANSSLIVSVHGFDEPVVISTRGWTRLAPGYMIRWIELGDDGWHKFRVGKLQPEETSTEE